MKKPYKLKLKGDAVARERTVDNKVLTSYVCKSCGKTKKTTTTMWMVNNQSRLLCNSCGSKAREKAKNNTTGFTGVMKYNKTGWQASLMTDGKRKRIFKIKDSELGDETSKILCALVRDQYIFLYALPHMKSFKTVKETVTVIEKLNHRAKKILLLASTELIQDLKKEKNELFTRNK